MSYELWEAIYTNRNSRLADKQEWRERLAEAEDRISRLESALVATVRALAFGETTYPSEDRPHQHALCGRETEQHLTRAAQALNLGLADLGLDWLKDVGDHAEQPTARDPANIWQTLSKVEAAEKAILNLPSSQWTGWITHILEAIDNELKDGDLGALEQIRDEITARIKAGGW